MTDVENAIIGMLAGFSDNEKVKIDVLEEEDFESDEAKEAFKLISDVAKINSGQVDIVLIGQYLEDLSIQMAQNGDKDKGFKSSFFVDLVDNVLSGEMFPTYIESLKNKRRSRDLKKTLYSAYNNVNGNPQKNIDLIDNLQTNIRSIYAGANDYDHEKVIYNTVEEVENLVKNGIEITTGYSSFDAVWGGFFKKDLYVIGADSGHFKTTLTLRLIINALEKGYKVLWLDGELGQTKLMRHFIALYGGIETWRVHKGIMNEQSWKKFADASAKVYNLPFIPIYNHFRLADINLEIMKYQPDIVVIDHLQCMDFPKSESFWTFHDAIVKLKHLTISSDVAMVALTQVTRNSNDIRKMTPPTIGNLFGSSAIKHEADAITLLHWPYKDMLNSGIPNSNVKKEEINAYHQKMRNDGLANVSMRLEPAFGRFFDIEGRRKSEEEKF